MNPIITPGRTTLSKLISWITTDSQWTQGPSSCGEPQHGKRPQSHGGTRSQKLPGRLEDQPTSEEGSLVSLCLHSRDICRRGGENSILATSPTLCSFLYENQAVSPQPHSLILPSAAAVPFSANECQNSFDYSPLHMLLVDETRTKQLQTKVPG